MSQMPESFRSVFGLGAPRQIYPARKSSKWVNVIGAGLFILGAAAILLYGVWITYSRWQENGPAVIAKTLLDPLILFLILFVIGLVLGWNTLSNWKKAVVVYENGFAYQDRKGLHTARWDEIAYLTSAVTKRYTNGVYTGTTHLYIIKKKDGTRVLLNDVISNVEEVASKIRSGAYPLLYQLYAQTYNAGQPLTFGPVILSKTGGIQIGKKIYPWEQVGKVSIQQGFIRVAKKDGGWFSGASAAASSIPNLELMLSIIDQKVGVAVKK